MGSVAAGIIGAPLTMVFLVLEVTGDFPLAMGVLAGVVASSALVRYSFGYSFSTWRFHQRGVAIRGAHDIGWIADLTVDKLMQADVKTVSADTTVLHLRETMPSGLLAKVFVVDVDGNYAGMFDLSAVFNAKLKGKEPPGPRISELAKDADRFLLPYQNVRSALATFAEAEAEVLPVLAGANDKRVIGFLSEAFALRRYAEALEHRRSSELGVQDLFGSAHEG